MKKSAVNWSQNDNETGVKKHGAKLKIYVIKVGAWSKKYKAMGKTNKPVNFPINFLLYYYPKHSSFID